MKKILIVDDNKESLVMMKALLENEYDVTPVPSGKLAIDFLEKKSADLILLDVQMPEMSGLEAIDIIKKMDSASNIPVLFLTGVESTDIESTCLEKGGDDYIRKPVDPVVLKRRIARLLELYELRYSLEDALKIKSAQLDRMALSSIITIANTVDAKDRYTGGHSLRVAICARDIAKNYGWNDDEVQNVYNVALLHDIGKIAVPDAVLNKNGRLDDEEFAIIKTHPDRGNEILKDITILPHVREGAHYHHEKWDGSGYPCGLKGEEIPVYARIISIADSYDAMNSDRAYRRHLSQDKIISEIERCKGTQFDPELADLFLFMLRGGYSIDPEITQMPTTGKIDHELEEIEPVRMPKAISIDVEQDSLTGLFNRSYLNIKVGNRILKDRAGVLMLIDFDNFRTINTKYGHIEGDIILKNFAESLKKEFREDDVVCRMGGDEFAVYLSGSQPREYVRQKAQDIIDKVRLSEVNAKYDKNLSVSIGISVCPDDGITFEELYSTADKALYHGTMSTRSMYHFYGGDEGVADMDSTEGDMILIKKIIEGQFVEDKGALSVDYSDFQNIYNYIYRYVDRNKNDVQVILFTIRPKAGRELEMSELDQAMHNLDIAVVDGLRKVDVGTRYSSNQYIVILTDTNVDNGDMVAKRVVERYDELSAGSDVTVLSFDLETITPAKNI